MRVVDLVALTVLPSAFMCIDAKPSPTAETVSAATRKFRICDAIWNLERAA